MDAEADDCDENHLDVFEEGIVIGVVEVDADFVGEYHRVIVFLKERIWSQDLIPS